jgi:prepilin-type N-terminal cleavage/methylation domain-containing protein
MQREHGFTLIELLMVLVIIGIILGLMIPNIRVMRNQAKAAAVQLNMKTVATAITAFQAENGHLADDFYEDGYGYVFEGGIKDEQLGRFPVNPYSGAEMDPDEFNVDEYDSELDVTNTNEFGPNDEWGYTPGEMRYANYIPLGATWPKTWGLVAFDYTGRSLRRFNSDGEPIIFVMY